MNDHTHRGRATGLNRSVDRRVLELDDALRGVELLSGAQSKLGLAADSTRAAPSRYQDILNAGQTMCGVVIHALPSVNWYKVQCGDGAGAISACMLTHSTMTPLGPRHIGMVGPNDTVLLLKPRGLNHAFIIGVVPPFTAEASVLVPDWIVQGGGSGLRRESGHAYPIKELFNSGGVIDWSAQRPQDQIGNEQGWITSFGMALTIDDYLIQMRVNEMAGLWMSYFDGWVRLAGEQLLIESPIHELEAQDDEGEARYFLGIATYVHEALGQYEKGQEFAVTNSDDAAQYSKHVGKIDTAKDLQPIYRYQEYHGYLGQGSLRFVMAPAESEHTYTNADMQDNGVFMESIGLDGAYSLIAAKSVHIGKRCRIVMPRAKTLPTAKTGDDAAEDNYKFASLFGSGPEHKVSNLKATGDVKSMLHAATTWDYTAYDCNWKALHPFHYHRGDYSTPQASEGDTLKKTQESIQFSAIESEFYVPDPSPKTLKIDPRYGDVEFFERESFIRMHDDGTVHIAGGAGEEIVMGGGCIFLNAPGGIHVRPGTDFTVHAAQIALKAKGSVDLSSTEHDVRLKAEKNMQFIAGNDGEGGMLFESRGTGTTQEYEGKYGEDVRSSGIVLKAAQSTVALLGQDIYLRTGGDTLGEGDILLDASQGKRRVQVYAREFHTYTTKAVTFNFGPQEEESIVRRVYYFGEDNMIADVKLLLGGKLIGYNGGGGSAGIVVDGGVYGTKSFATAGVMADRKGGMLGQVPGGFASTITATTNLAGTTLNIIREESTLRHQTSIVQKYYQFAQLGDEALIENMQFSFRDPPGTPIQYKAEGFKWPESRWQQMVRFGLGSGGVGWTERPVIYQGELTYPWPGVEKWVADTTFLQLDELKLYDAANGVDKERPGEYEQAELGTFEKTQVDSNYKLIY